MVFNWFRRQFSRPEEAQEQQPTQEEAPEVAEESAAEGEESGEAQAADDYLEWAKAAYQNIKKQQETQEPDELEEPAAPEEPVAEAEPEPIPEPEPEAEPEPEVAEPEPEVAAPEVAEPAIAELAVAEPEVPEPEPEVIEPEEAEPVAAAEVPAPEAEPETVAAETAPEAIAPPEPETERPEAEAAEPEVPEPEPVAEAAEPAAPEEAEPEAVEPEPPVVAASAAEPAAPAIAEEPPTPEAEAPADAPEEVVEAAPLPFWAQAEADRQERMERLRATAMEEPEPEVSTPSSAATEEFVLPIDFDEGFLWSAEILAAQGRRPDQVSIEEITWLKRLRQGLDKTRRGLINQLKAIVGQGPLNQDAVLEIEALLLQADVGYEATDHIITALQSKLREETLPPEEAIAYLKQILRELLDTPLNNTANYAFAPEPDTLNIWLMTGVNGAGKTTTIGKLAHLASKSDYKCLIAAADTFRAAAVQQVKVWGDRSSVEVIANPGKNTDPAAVVYDAIAAAQSRDIELLLVDTAGRLQNKKNLMEELAKIRRIVDKKAPDAKIESLLVLDATLGQNGLRQAEVFAEAAQLSGVVLTKLDGTAKGGIALAVVQQLGLPIRFIGAGEGIEDLRPFSSYEFVEALLNG
ncbi:signal recognition particle-docking protein FtsY [Geitlerinema sp. PCC 7407]|uniref:signal recognition particle-docking protein FtsY n=1 Tax=Geitlerinema sp. PCC 7407 TaxID=1173025 RepID=UPI00029FD352|nr:signal recognition particle-docking protein FtsY [Geitlerinema sp. PCC 7407]AFY67959.1 signal recognition particle-docking protein FtsY [Geitlerinema sp. PCC 7407]